MASAAETRARLWQQIEQTEKKVGETTQELALLQAQIDTQENKAEAERTPDLLPRLRKSYELEQERRNMVEAQLLAAYATAISKLPAPPGGGSDVPSLYGASPGPSSKACANSDRRPWSDAWAAFWADRFVMDMQAAIEEFSGTVKDNFKAWHEAILLACIHQRHVDGHTPIARLYDTRFFHFEGGRGQCL